jgi:carbonic anhydrase
MTPPAQSWTQQLLRNADSYHRSFDKPTAPRRPRTGVAVVSCLDARLNIYGMLGLAEGDAHLIRNAGGVVSDDVVRSLTIGQHLLGTTEIMLIMHDDCGMLTITDGEFADRLHARAGLRPDWRAMAFTDTEQELRAGLDALRQNPFLLNSAQIRGFIYNETAGNLRELE